MPRGAWPATEYRLYFGLNDSKGGTILQEDWQNFGYCLSFSLRNK